MHLVRAATLTGFTGLLRQFDGPDAACLLREAGLPADCLLPETEDQYLPHAQIEVLLSLAASYTHCPHFSLLLGARQELSMLGIIGFVMQQSPDVRNALAELQRHFYLQAQGSGIEVSLVGDTVKLAFVVYDAARLRTIRHSTELCLAAGMPIMSALCGATFKPTVVHFTHEQPSDVTPYRRVFGAPVLFGQEENVVEFPVSWLDTRISSADAQLSRILHTYLDLLETRYADDLAAQVQHLIRRALSSGVCSADNVAAFMGMHRRTLHRQLKRQGTSFTQLLELVRQDIAARTLAHSKVSVTLLSDMLCYSDVSAFTRAFKRWNRATPQQWRRRNSVHARCKE